MNIEIAKSWTKEKATEQLLRCCGCKSWAERVAERLPAGSWDELLTSIALSFDKMQDEEWLEAFSAHPKIGDLESMRKKFANTRAWSEGEQGGMNEAAADLLEQLAAANHKYEEKNGFIFIVCASGKSPREMLTLLNQRMDNDRQTEIKIASEEQKKITQLRLEKLFA